MRIISTLALIVATATPALADSTSPFAVTPFDATVISELSDAERNSIVAELSDAERNSIVAELSDAERKHQVAELSDAERKAQFV